MEKYQNCNCIERIEEVGLRMDSLRSRLRACDFWLQGMESRFSYIPAEGDNMDNPPAYMMCRTLLNYSKTAMDDALKDIRVLLQKQRRNGHTAPATQRQSRRLLKKHHDLVTNMRARCIPLYDRISESLRKITSGPKKFADWLIPSASISKEQVDNGDQCAVCLEDFAVDEIVCQLGCAHCFHIHCMDPLIKTNWMKKDFRCPLCRRQFLETP